MELRRGGSDGAVRVACGAEFHIRVWKINRSTVISTTMDVITAAAAMTAAMGKSDRCTDDETQRPPRKRLRRQADVSSSSIWSSYAGVVQPAAHRAAATPSVPPIDLCPLCGNATFKKGGLREEVDIVARGQVGGAVAAGTGRYKIRKEPRKDNRLAAWYSRFGYRGPLYCKACSGTC